MRLLDSVILATGIGFFLGISQAQPQQKEYITIADGKGKIIACRKDGFTTLTIKFSTLASYQKMYSQQHLVLDPDPPTNLTLEVGGYTRPCSEFEKEIIKKITPEKFPKKPTKTELEKAVANFPISGIGFFCEAGVIRSYLLEKEDEKKPPKVVLSPYKGSACVEDAMKKFYFEGT